MLINDREIIKRLKIKSKDRVLDVGGSMQQHELIQIDTLVDIIRPEEAPYISSNLKAARFVQADITRDKLPFKDKEFDVCLCTHTLEDLSNPFLIMNEMSRVAKRGIIVTPSMGIDMVFSDIDFTDWLTGFRRVPGQAHHKWFFVKEKGIIKVIPKNFPILYTSDFHIVKWLGSPEFIYVWNNDINYKEFISLNIHNLIDEYKRFLTFNTKSIKFGKVLYFIDSPLAIFKAFIKKLLRRGEGYTYRKNFKV
ncbi:MAG TPA: methyltransferase domain-containing protein [Patescibacteria group bacterium]|nr:methyltransferase domain-containing protein [Patescibacteria group bacterium]